MKNWKMPKWMEPYRGCIVGNGEAVEDLVNDRTLVQVNAPRALIASGVSCQVGLLMRLRAAGMIAGEKHDGGK